MAATPQPTWTAAPPRERMGAGRVIALVLGILVLLPGLGLALAGGVLLYADGPGRNDDGYLYSASDSFSTDGYAITSASIELAPGADWVPVSSAVGTARIEVTGTDGSDVFLGVSPVADATEYIGGVERSIVTDLGSDAAPAVRTGAGAPSTPPGEQDFWVAQTEGSGTQTLTWRPATGDWTLIVMNSDGSAGVSVDARLGATVPALTGLAWGVLAGGLFLLAIGVLMIVLALHRPRTAAPRPPYAGVPGSGPPPPWTPPAPVDRTTAADARLEAPSDQRPPAGT